MSRNPLLPIPDPQSCLRTVLEYGAGSGMERGGWWDSWMKGRSLPAGCFTVGICGIPQTKRALPQAFQATYHSSFLCKAPVSHSWARKLDVGNFRADISIQRSQWQRLDFCLWASPGIPAPLPSKISTFFGGVLIFHRPMSGLHLKSGLYLWCVGSQQMEQSASKNVSLCSSFKTQPKQWN